MAQIAAFSGVQVVDILKQTAESRQALLFSATLPSALAEFASAGLRSPQLVRLDADTKLSPTLALQFFNVRESDKPACLLVLLQARLSPPLHTLPENPTCSCDATSSSAVHHNTAHNQQLHEWVT